MSTALILALGCAVLAVVCVLSLVSKHAHRLVLYAGSHLVPSSVTGSAMITHALTNVMARVFLTT